MKIDNTCTVDSFHQHKTETVITYLAWWFTAGVYLLGTTMIEWINTRPEYIKNFMLSDSYLFRNFNNSWIFKTFQDYFNLKTLPPFQTLLQNFIIKWKVPIVLLKASYLFKVYLHFLSVTLRDQLLWLHDDEGSHTSARKHKKHSVSYMYNVCGRTIFIQL